MDKFKKFLEKKKVNRHFKNTGQGARLSDNPSNAPSAPSTHGGSAQGSSQDRVHTADVAAQAALRRLYANEPQVSSHQKKIQILAKRELEAERKQAETQVEALQINEPEVKDFDHSNVISSVLFTCELLGGEVALPKAQMSDAIETFLREQLNSDDALVASILLIYSLNRKEERLRAVETIGKYLQNVLENPDEPKYRKIRLGNKAFQERVESAKGGREFLTSVGFQSVTEGGEQFLVLSDEAANDIARLVEALEMLREGEAVPLKVYRNTQIYSLKENEKVPMPRVPPDFFDLSVAELKQHQAALTAHVERLTTLRTREMRQKDETLRQFTYRYTLIRARLPDRFVLEGVFSVHEPLSAVETWISSHLPPWASFTLSDPVSGSFGDSKESLASCGLIPAAVIHIDFDADTKEQFRSAGRATFLEDNFIAEAKPLAT